MDSPLRVTVWNEYRHERKDGPIKQIYPDGMHAPIARYLESNGCRVRIATLDDPEHGLSQDVLDSTDVLTWWGHNFHEAVQDHVVDRVHKRVLSGMGLIALHSSHMSKIFRRLMGTTGLLRWRKAAERERLWTIEPGHPIADGIGDYIELPASEMYGERFDIPAPEKIIFISWFQGGDVFRSGCTWERGHGRVFYFSPGDESYPIYHNEQVLHVILNAAPWARPRVNSLPKLIKAADPLEKIS
ncbi:MAG: trehalose utilization protein ThuA [SAR202 cluster bacterium]|nr:trehalose utilization protein ThuA [SAR202 cluster bacterium]